MMTSIMKVVFSIYNLHLVICISHPLIGNSFCMYVYKRFFASSDLWSAKMECQKPHCGE